jgi:hypothetical protein
MPMTSSRPIAFLMRKYNANRQKYFSTGRNVAPLPEDRVHFSIRESDSKVAINDRFKVDKIPGKEIHNGMASTIHYPQK